MCELKYEFFPWRACRAQIAAGTVARLDVRIALPSHRPSFPADRRMHLKLSTVRIGRRRRHLARPPMGRLTPSYRSIACSRWLEAVCTLPHAVVQADA